MFGAAYVYVFSERNRTFGRNLAFHSSLVLGAFFYAIRWMHTAGRNVEKLRWLLGGERSMKGYKKLMDIVAMVEKTVLVLTMILILVLTVGNVFSRKVIHQS